jgi:hypothetical protein
MAGLPGVDFAAPKREGLVCGRGTGGSGARVVNLWVRRRG